MSTTPQLLIYLTEFVLGGTIVLAVTALIVKRLRQPIDRVNLITMSIVSSAIVPLLLSFASIPSWQLGLFSIDSTPINSVGTTDGSNLASKRQPMHANAVKIATVQLEKEAGLDSYPVVAPELPAHASGIISNEGVNDVELSTHTNSNGPQFQTTIWSRIAGILLCVQLAVMLWYFIQWFLGLRQLRSISRRAVDADPAITKLWDEISDSRKYQVRLLVSHEIQTPTLFGPTLFKWRRPVILLPYRLADGDPSALRFCLTHEWSHIKCHDLLKWQLISLCELVWWYQPLYWLLRREVKVCQDLVADNLAADLETNQLARIEYSELLLSIAKESKHPSIMGGMAFYDSSSQLTRRIKMLLTDGQSLKNRSTQKFCCISGVSMLLLIAMLSSLRLSTVQAQESEPKKTDQIAVEKVNEQASGQHADIQSDPSNVKIVRGQVLDAKGKPVANATVCLPLQWRPRQIVEGVTDSAGWFELKCPIDWLTPGSTNGQWRVWVYAQGHNIQSQSVYKTLREGQSDEHIIQLPKESTARFKVLDPNGRPIVGVQVEPNNYHTTGGFNLVPSELRSKMAAITDEDGIVALPSVQSIKLVNINTQHVDYGRQLIRVDDVLRTHISVAEVQEVRLRAAGSIKGRLTSKNPEWIRNVRVSFTTNNQDQIDFPTGWAESVSDEEGNFYIPKIASGGPLHSFVMIDPSLPVRPVVSEHASLAGNETIEMEIPVVDAPLVSGKVVEKSTGRPVVNAEISLIYGGFQQHDKALTNENGEYRGRVLPGKVRVQINSLPDDFMQQGTQLNESYDVPENVDNFTLPTIEVVGSSELQGLLIGVNDEPLPNMEVFAIDGNKRYGFCISDAEGCFTMRVPDDIETQIRVYLEKRGSYAVQVVQKDPLIVRYVAEPAEEEMRAKRALLSDVTLSGRVLLGDEPIGDIPIKLNRVVSESVDSQGRRTKLFNEVSNTTTDVNGNYRLSGLKGGDEYQIEIKPPFNAADLRWPYQEPHSNSLRVDAKGEIALYDAKLTRLSQSISGIVVDPEGNPVQDATISVQFRTGEYVTMYPSYGPLVRKTDRNGRFQITRLPDEDLKVVAYHSTSEDGRIRYPTKVNVERNQQGIRIVLNP